MTTLQPPAGMHRTSSARKKHVKRGERKRTLVNSDTLREQKVIMQEASNNHNNLLHARSHLQDIYL